VFSQQGFKKPQIQNFMKIRPAEAKLFHAEKGRGGRTERHGEADTRFSQFCEPA
jgi:hypothetical protein